MLKVYDKNTTDFSNNGLAVLNKAKKVNVSSEINGEYKLTFELPGDDPKWQYLQQRNKVLCEGQQYRVFRYGQTIEGAINKSVECIHVIADAAAKGEKFIPYLSDMIGYTPRSIMLTAFAGTSFHIMTEEEVTALGMLWITDLTDIFECSKTYPLEVVKKLIETLHKGELYIDNYNIALVERIGKDTGLNCTLANNLQSIGNNNDGVNIVTRLYAYGKDDLPLPLGVAPNGYIDSTEGIALYGICADSMSFDTEDPNELYQKALWQFSSDNPKRIDIEEDSYTIKLIELYKLFGNNFKVNLGDSINIINRRSGIETKQRIVKYNKYPYSSDESDVTLGRPPKTYADVIKSSANTSQKYNSTVNQSGEVKAAWLENLIGNLKQTVYAGLVKELALHKSGDLWEFGNNTAIAIVDGVLAIANNRSPDGTWNFRSFGDGNGFTADEIVAGILKGIQIQQISDNGKILMEVFKDIYGGVIKVYDNNEYLNAKLGVESGTSDNQGGTLILFIDSPYESAPEYITYQRVEFGIVSGNGGGNLRDLNGKVRVSLWGSSTFPYVGVRNSNEELVSYLSETIGKINGENIAVQSWVNSLIQSYSAKKGNTTGTDGHHHTIEIDGVTYNTSSEWHNHTQT